MDKQAEGMLAGNLVGYILMVAVIAIILVLTAPNIIELFKTQETITDVNKTISSRLQSVTPMCSQASDQECLGHESGYQWEEGDRLYRCRLDPADCEEAECVCKKQGLTT